MGCAQVCTLPREGTGSCAKHLPPTINGPHGGWTGPSFPQGYSLSGVPLTPQFPPSGLPRLTLPLSSLHPQPVHLAQVSFVIPAFNSNFTLDLELNQ